MEERKLYRSRTDRMIAGVCGGIAEYFGMDPSIVRILAVVLGVVGNAAVAIVYIVLWVVVPEQPIEYVEQQQRPEVTVPIASATTSPEYAAYAADATPEPSAPPAPEPQPVPTVPGVPHAAPTPVPHEHHGVRTGLIWFGILLIVLGGALLADRVFPYANLWGFWPGTLIGVLFIVSGIRTMVTSGGDDR